MQSAITLDEPSPDSVPTPTAEPVAVKRPNRKESESQAPAKNVSVAAAAIPQPVPAVARPETANLSGVDSTPVAPALNETKNKPVDSQPKQKAQADTEKTPVKPAPSPSEIAQASAKPASKKPETKKPAPVAGSASKSASANKKALTAVDANGAPNPLRVSTSWELSSVRMRRKRLLLRRSRQRSRTPQAKLKNRLRTVLLRAPVPSRRGRRTARGATSAITPPSGAAGTRDYVPVVLAASCISAAVEKTPGARESSQNRRFSALQMVKIGYYLVP